LCTLKPSETNTQGPVRHLPGWNWNSSHYLPWATGARSVYSYIDKRKSVRRSHAQYRLGTCWAVWRDSNLRCCRTRCCRTSCEMVIQMNTTKNFDYEMFLALAGSDVVAYMERLVNDTTTKISRDDLERMLLDLPMFDEYHLVYALELGIAHAPDIFAPQIPQYLGHGSAAVCSTASRVLNKLPSQYVTQNLIDAVRSIPIDNSLITEPIDGTRHLVGLNTCLVRDVLTKLETRRERD
jgi:hypothetical protein